MPLVLLPDRHAWNTSSGRHPGGILAWCLHQLSWLLWIQKSSTSTLIPSVMSNFTSKVEPSHPVKKHFNLIYNLIISFFTHHWWWPMTRVGTAKKTSSAKYPTSIEILIHFYNFFLITIFLKDVKYLPSITSYILNWFQFRLISFINALWLNLSFCGFRTTSSGRETQLKQAEVRQRRLWRSSAQHVSILLNETIHNYALYSQCIYSVFLGKLYSHLESFAVFFSAALLSCLRLASS